MLLDAERPICGIVLLAPVKRVLVLTFLVGCKFFVFRTVSGARGNVMESNSKRCSINTRPNHRREPLSSSSTEDTLLFSFFYRLSFSFILFFVILYNLHYLKPGPILRNASAFFSFYLIYFFP